MLNLLLNIAKSIDSFIGVRFDFHYGVYLECTDGPYVWAVSRNSENTNFYSIMENNFYHSDFYLNPNLILEVTPELILIFFIFYSLINLFNDKTTVIFQFYK